MSEQTRFPETLTDLRERSGINQCELARRAGVNHSIISRLEADAGKSGSRVPTREMVGKLARGLNLKGRDRSELFLAAGFVAPEMCGEAVLLAYDELDYVRRDCDPDVDTATNLLSWAVSEFYRAALGNPDGLQLAAIRMAGLSLLLVDLLAQKHHERGPAVCDALEAVAS